MRFDFPPYPHHRASGAMRAGPLCEAEPRRCSPTNRACALLTARHVGEGYRKYDDEDLERRHRRLEHSGRLEPRRRSGSRDDAVISFGTVSLHTPVTVGSISLTTSGATLGIVDPGTDTVTGDFSNSGTVGVDFGTSSGTTLTIGGTLTNTASGSFNVGYSNLPADSIV